MLKLMIVEDELMERKAINHLLSKYYENKIELINEVNNGVEAVNKGIEKRIDIILMDIQIPKIDGLKASEKIKEQSPDTEIIIITAHSKFDYAQKSIQVGVNDYLVKPYSEQEFCSVLNKNIKKINNMKKKKSRQKEIIKKINDIRPILEKEMILEIIFGTRSHLKRYKEMKRIFGIKGEEFMFLVITMRKDEEKYLTEDLFKKLKIKLNKIVNGIIAYDGLNNMVFLLIGDEIGKKTNSKRVIQLIDKIKKNFYKKNERELLIGKSSIYSDISKLSEAYNESKAAFRDEKFEKMRKCPYQKEKYIYGKLIDKDLEGAVKGLNSMFNYLKKENSNDIKEIKHYLKQFIIFLDRSMMEFFDTKEEIINVYKVEEDLNIINSIVELKEYLITIFRKTINKISAKRKDKKVEIIDMVKKYINEHYDEDITLEQIAEYVSFSKYYLSRIFKEVEGINYKKYLIKVRMEKAKEMLEEGESIKVIAFSVGYSNRNYFSSSFKKYTGIPPGQY